MIKLEDHVIINLGAGQNKCNGIVVGFAYDDQLLVVNDRSRVLMDSYYANQNNVDQKYIGKYFWICRPETLTIKYRPKQLCCVCHSK